MLIDFLSTAFVVSSQIWTMDSREKMLRFVCEQICELEACTAVIIADRSGEYVRAKEDVFFCEWLRYLPRALTIVRKERCKCRVEHDLMLAVPLDDAAAYVFLKNVPEECLQVLKDLFIVVSKALEARRAEEEKRAAMFRLRRNLEYFAFLSDRFRNPLAVILGVVELKEDFEVDRAFLLIRDSAMKMKEILDRLSEEEVKTRRFVSLHERV